MRRRCLRLLPLLAVAALVSVLLVLSKRRVDDGGGVGLGVGVAVEEHWPPYRSDQREFVDRRGIRVVVGRYVGDDGDGGPEDNLTRAELDANEFSPVSTAGQDGQPVFLEPHLAARSRRLYRANRFNLLASDRIPLNRTLPDVRHNRCRGKYDQLSESLLNTSVVIVFHNEAWSTLLRTVHSVVDRSPRRLLHEILLVDDHSDRAFLGSPLERHASSLPVPCRVLRTERRVGLVRARLLGANHATGQVLTFLDAHCECTTGWLEPLLERVSSDRQRVACPVIDIINEDTFAYERSFELHWGAFNWDLHFRWYSLGASELRRRRKDLTLPFRTPAMAGGLFAVERSYFFELGAYDEGMDIWGGENLEMSFRVWMCGGSVEVCPCSHVGHVFRRSSPYSFPGGVSEVLYANLARVALVWMDDWADFYFMYNPDANRLRSQQEPLVSERRALRRRLKCRDFSWYLNNVWPTNFFPSHDRFFGQIEHQPSGLCLRRPSPRPSVNQPSGAALLGSCGAQASDPRFRLPAAFVMSPGGTVATDESLCLEAAEGRPAGSPAHIVACSGLERQRWRHRAKTMSLEHAPSGLCLGVSGSAKEGAAVETQPCAQTSPGQRWLLRPLPWR